MKSISMTYTDLFPHLIANQLVEPIALESLTPSFSEWYNPDAHYVYHVGILGHLIEDCAPFKDKVQRLIQSSVLSFVMEEQLISEAIEEDIVVVITTFDSHIEEDENAIECSV